ncbi:MAG: hypothetical protein Q8P92_01155 [Candidatus Daviesbacteria bacterium]|nr:hypothetical protein [Candidatus Daviesbacteria bacterium]
MLELEQTGGVMGFVSRKSQVGRKPEEATKQQVIQKVTQPINLDPTRSVVRVAPGRFMDISTGKSLNYR